MKYWSISYLDHNALGEIYVHHETLSDKEILDAFWVQWFTHMIEAKRPDFELTPENCIDDWCLLHHAERNHWREIKEYYE